MRTFIKPIRAGLCLCQALLFFSTTYVWSAGANEPKSWFTENKGQVVDQFGRLRNDVQFLYVNGDFKLILKANGFSYELTNQSKSISVSEATGLSEFADEDEYAADEARTIGVSRVEVSLRGCNDNPVIEATGPSSFYQNYYNQHTGYPGITGVRSYKKIIYKDIYPGIDLVFTIRDSKEINRNIVLYFIPAVIHEEFNSLILEQLKPC
jgi:hypothetical protein